MPVPESRVLASPGLRRRKKKPSGPEPIAQVPHRIDFASQVLFVDTLIANTDFVFGDVPPLFFENSPLLG